MSKKTSLDRFYDLGTRCFGGGFLKGNPRIARPVSFKKPIHLVLKSDFAVGSKSFLRRPYSLFIENQTKKLSRLFGIKIYRLVNNGNHLHLILVPRSRKSLNGFLRSFTGVLARKVLSAERGAAQQKQFWAARPFSRILDWTVGFRTCSVFLKQELPHVLGFENLNTTYSSA